MIVLDLPQKFKEKLKAILKNKYDLFLENFSNNPFRALRINTLKADKQLLSKEFDFLNTSTPFCKDSYYIPEDISKLGNHPLHHAGAFYLQEPSASSVVEALGIEEGDIVLDLCASPGGKSTQAAAKLNGTGFLVSNEFVSSRVAPLISNIERMGITNCAVTSLRPDFLCEQLTQCFDKVIVDAPCSGEGMFRKESEALVNWSEENVLSCAKRQEKILNSAAKTVKFGGKLVYSTCTYSFEENEQVIAAFLNENKDFELIKPCINFGESAVVDFAPDTKNIEYARRIFNFNGGEGHFVAVMKRLGESIPNSFNKHTVKNKADIEKAKIFKEFYNEYFNYELQKNIEISGDKVYITQCPLQLNDLKPIRNGIFAGTVRNGRFIPEHALFNNCDLIPKNVLELSIDDKRLAAFLHGEEIACDESLKGFAQVRAMGIPLGFGKANTGVLKNHYPKGLRTL